MGTADTGVIFTAGVILVADMGVIAKKKND
jgi:hypothetical protein